MLGYKKGNKKLLTGQIPLHYPADRVYLGGDTTKTVQDKCARKADLTNLDLTGTTNTTGSTIASGTYFYLDGVLVRAKTAIANGATFTLNTNYEVVTAGGLNSISKKTEFTPTIDTNFTPLSGAKSWAYIENNTVHLHYTLYKSSTGAFAYGTYYYPLQLPANVVPDVAIHFTPRFSCQGGAAGTQNTAIGYGTINTSGTVIVMPQNGTSGMNGVNIDISYPL